MKDRINTAYEVIKYFKERDNEAWPPLEVGKILVNFVNDTCDIISAIISSQAHLTELNPHPFLKHEQAFETFLDTIGGHYAEEK